MPAGPGRSASVTWASSIGPSSESARISASGPRPRPKNEIGSTRNGSIWRATDRTERWGSRRAISAVGRRRSPSASHPPGTSSSGPGQATNASPVTCSGANRRGGGRARPATGPRNDPEPGDTERLHQLEGVARDPYDRRGLDRVRLAVPRAIEGDQSHSGGGGLRGARSEPARTRRAMEEQDRRAVGVAIFVREGATVSELQAGHSRRRCSVYSWTNSINVPNAPFGCTNATVVPRLPGRGASSITR